MQCILFVNQVLDAVARMACLGCEKPYREVVVLLAMSYLKKLAAIGSPESNSLTREAKMELEQVFWFRWAMCI